MTAAPAALLAVHATLENAEPGSPPRIVVRVVFHPRLGFPLGPFAVRTDSRPATTIDVPFRLSGPGVRPGQAIDGEALVDLDLPVPESWPSSRPVLAVVGGVMGTGVEVSVVRPWGEPGTGLVSRRQHRYVLSAPHVSRLRVMGQCTLSSVHVTYPEFILDDRAYGPVAYSIMGLPLGEVRDEHGRPRYLGKDEDQSAARDRVRRGAPRDTAPHEHPLPIGDPRRPRPTVDDEEARVVALVSEGVTNFLGPATGTRRIVSLGDPLPRPPGSRAAPATATVDAVDALLIAASDAGLARWMGLACLLDRPELRFDHISVTVTGRWTLPNDAWGDFVGRFDDSSTVKFILDPAELGGQMDHSPSSGERVVSLWAQAIIDPSAPPERPMPPRLEEAGGGTWISVDDRDAVRLPLTLRRTAPLGQLGIARVNADGGVAPLAQPIASLPDRPRPMAATDGAAITDVVRDPPAGPMTYRFWQADLFGRWSGSSPDVSVPLPARLSLPAPRPVIQVLSVEPVPEHGSPLSPRLHVTVPVPARVPGQPTISRVTARLGSERRSVDITAHTEVVWPDIHGPSLVPAQQSTEDLVVCFEGTAASERACSTTQLMLTDPRPPDPPKVPGVLHFTDRPDAAGHAHARIDLPEGSGIHSWDVYATTETRLRRSGLVGAEPSADRNTRAAAWLALAGSMPRECFDSLTLTPVPASEPAYSLKLSGDLAEIVIVRLVPRGPGGGSPPFGACPTIPVAVPFSIAPSAPDVRIEDTDEGPVILITPRGGRVLPDRYRVRLATTAPGDVRAAPIVADGSLTTPVSQVKLSGLEPFARVWILAEVRGLAENGSPPAPGAWSPPSTPLEFVAVPSDPPQLITGAMARSRDGTTSVEVTLVGLPRDSYPRPFRLYLYRRDHRHASPVLAQVGAPGTGFSEPTIPGATYLVQLVDPLGRGAAPVEVLGSKP
jgi:hypothetical protein